MLYPIGPSLAYERGLGLLNGFLDTLQPAISQIMVCSGGIDLGLFARRIQLIALRRKALMTYDERSQ